MYDRNARRQYKKRALKERPLLRDAIAELRKEAFEKRGEVVRKIVAGWSFCLDVDHLRGQLPTIKDIGKEKFAALLDSFGFGYLKDSADICLTEDCSKHDHLHFSARVYPPTRGSDSEDWKNLGLAGALLGVPDASLGAAMSAIRDDVVVSTRAIHYAWTEPKSDAPKKSA